MCIIVAAAIKAKQKGERTVMPHQYEILKLVMVFLRIPFQRKLIKRLILHEAILVTIA